MDAGDDDAANSKRQSLDIPPPERDGKRSKSEEKEDPLQLASMQR